LAHKSQLALPEEKLSYLPDLDPAKNKVWANGREESRMTNHRGLSRSERKMANTSKTTKRPIITKRQAQVRREWSTAERQLRSITASLAQQQLYLLIAGRGRSLAG
jgi:hypothetical protein